MAYVPPNLFVPGTHKAGTTFLCSHLAEHPQICFAKPKEPMFFTGRITDASLEEYGNAFYGARATAAGVRYIGEGSTTYFQNPKALAAILEHAAKDLKAIVCLRQPVSKSVSFFMHLFKQKHITGRERIVDFTHPQRSVYVSGKYADAAEAWISALGRDNILFLKFDTLIASPDIFVGDATRFLGIDPVNQENISTKRINIGYNIRLRHDFIESAPRGRRNPLPDWQTYPRIYRHELELLQAYFAPDIERTAKVTGLDLSDWMQMPTDFVSSTER